ncbi:hypothetical protein [Ornithobacterium rhinotracheale]|uniref:Uncharacterized protein n=1 Tax=Ornithobacterium rhinotracheale (strain ATCC 51463 / DSM 15997 / CCUG 23171 / CIP 104009 / LMG 9086) TaxID=867902 RepID=I4A2Y8_ORNRL|nr:hypothetical protein [Ornithobacterium rhinotracheale]AFL96647.1 hypothetical protein Ornrh_0440 [Ornithobacterium rhinotracheale DSM 15997]AFL97275.1 hypothetical protein Ornrh_1085 [Ornithobacterium rhinotracheale DSM 15997]AFL97779.1 hypothetical protein Ornrh_1621 [Ornithobacterium rhinotracheale DSM 15997]AFL98322.1 hypothetical protein Ornrh_2190 [Ornithobacterium rhinotracheale DSM 15997]AIP98810.1 hypothetical protein Q785_02320 [Ornithobacterium rhinotracheale ORT-UMN 88]
MKKILLSFGLCLAVTAGYAQSKEAKKEIRKYYTEKQIKYIEKELKEYISNCDDILNLSNSLDEKLFKNKGHLIAYFDFFINPLYDDFCTKGEVYGYGLKISRLINGE